MRFENEGCVIFPTPVGVFLPTLQLGTSACNLPHTRGGVSKIIKRDVKAPLSSPHPWGCFYQGQEKWFPPAIFPTPVGVFPVPHLRLLQQPHLPHTRGGVSVSQQIIRRVSRSSPHPWGCFQTKYKRNQFLHIFPTPVGVFLAARPMLRGSFHLPHTRGGVSENTKRRRETI